MTPPVMAVSSPPTRLLVLLDSGPLGAVTHPRGDAEAQRCKAWLARILADGRRILIPEICYYETRRERRKSRFPGDNMETNVFSQLPNVDTATVVTLTQLGRNGDYFSTGPYPMVGQFPAGPEDAQRVADLWRRLTPLAGSGGNLCHSPRFGLRFSQGQRTVLEGSVCWQCWNVKAVAAGELFGAGFDINTEASWALLVLLQQMTGSKPLVGLVRDF